MVCNCVLPSERRNLDCTNVLPLQRGGAVPSPMGMGRNGRTDLPRGSTERSPPLSRTVFSLGRLLTGHNWAAPLLLIDRTPYGVSLSWHCSLLVAMSILTQAPSATTSPQVPLLHLPSGCGQRFSSMFCLPRVGAFPLLLPYPC